jgi:predicted SAM-dependent methyltransferase
MTQATEPIRLNLGGADRNPPGFICIDRKNGMEAYPLKYADNSVDEIRASHLLEHFGMAEVELVIEDWVRVLKPGGLLRIAVPDMVKLTAILADEKSPPPFDQVVAARCIAGGQDNANEYHKSFFTESLLNRLLISCGIREISHWTSEIEDCAGYPISLNLQGRKLSQPVRAMPSPLGVKAGALMTMPRLCWTDSMFCVLESTIPLGIGVKRVTGVYWDQCMTRGLEEFITEGMDYILCIDYDSIFKPEHVKELFRLMEANPHVDALAPSQVKREEDSNMLVIRDRDGKVMSKVQASEMAGDLLKIETAHFGLTILRVSSLKKLARPWFWSKPDPKGAWGEGRIDPDIYFWHNWKECGLTLYHANNVRIGHLQTMVTWAGKEFKPTHQYMREYASTGIPADVPKPGGGA